MTKKVFNPSYGKNADLFGRTQKDTAVTSEKKTRECAYSNLNESNLDEDSSTSAPRKSLEGRTELSPSDSSSRGFFIFIGAISALTALVYFCNAESSSGPGTTSKLYQPPYQQSQPHQVLKTYQQPRQEAIKKGQRNQIEKGKGPLKDIPEKKGSYGLRNPLDSLQQGFKEFEKTQRKVYKRYRLHTRPR
jgi:hypothetical protein